MIEANRIANAAAAWRLSVRCRVAAEELAAGDLHDRATSQLHFALLHAVRALLFTEGLEPRSHRGARHLLNLHFVVPGRVGRELLLLLQELQDEREAADYSSGYPNDPARYGSLAARTATALDDLRGRLANAGVAL